MLTLEEEISVREPGTAGSVTDAELVSISLPGSALPLALVAATVVMRNSGDSIWSEAGDHSSGHRLGSLAGDELSWVPRAYEGYSNSVADQRIFLTSPVVAGGEASFDFHVQAPAVEGSYQLRARMVQDGVAWFGAEVLASLVVTASVDAGVAVDSAVVADANVAPDSALFPDATQLADAAQLPDVTQQVDAAQGPGSSSEPDRGALFYDAGAQSDADVTTPSAEGCGCHSGGETQLPGWLALLSLMWLAAAQRKQARVGAKR